VSLTPPAPPTIAVIEVKGPLLNGDPDPGAPASIICSCIIILVAIKSQES